ncbi:MAG: hypothetical protein PVG43_05300 [Nitrosopumilaceae archaeon]|jgi:hypothetical protein
MNYSILVFSIIFSVLIILPSANAQIFDDSKQRSIEVKINSLGEVKVTHVVAAQNDPHQIALLDGKKENLVVTNEVEEEIQYEIIGDKESLVIFPSKKDVIVKYDLIDELVMKENLWTLDFLYLQSTSFLLPEEADLIYVNNKPVMLGDKKGIMCHGCQMMLEYSLKEPKISKKIKNLDEEYSFEFRTFAEIDQFGLNQKKNGLNFDVIGENKFVTITVPVNFMAQPYQVFLDGEKIFFQDYIDNGTHVWITMRPENSGTVTITGTIIPDVSSISQIDYLSFVYVGIIIIIGIVVVVFFAKKKKDKN